MKRKNSTRNALVTSVISLLLCVSMLVGTTFAWFTDSVTSSGNKIQSGTLDIELYELVDGEWDAISKDNRALFDYDLWEPGYTEATVLKVTNEGSLALKWAATVTPISAETVSILADVIDVYVLEGATTAPASFEDIKSNYTLKGTLREFMTGLAANTTGTLYPETSGQVFEATLGIALHMREEAGNEYQGLELGSEFDIRIFATQVNYEEDTFGPDYDINAKYSADYEVAQTVPVTTTKDANDNVISASVTNDITVNLGVQDDSVVTEASVAVPAGTAVDPDAVEDGNVVLNVSVKEAEETPSNITVGDDQEALPLVIEVDGLANGNEKVLTVHLNIGAGRTGLVLYHYAVQMTELNAPATEPEHNQFYYDAATGDLYIYASSFSPFTIVNDGAPVVKTEDELIRAMATGDLFKLGANVEITKNITLDKNVYVDLTKYSLKVAEDVNVTIDLNGKSFNAVSEVADKNDDNNYTSADNEIVIDVRGTLTVKNGTMTLNHKGENLGWNGCTELFYVGFNGTLNVESATLENLGGSDMAYVVDMVNADAKGTGITVNVKNSTLKSSYIPFRVFNNGAGMNAVTIENTKLLGVSRALWVHIYTAADNKGTVKDATLDLNIYGKNNTFEATNPNRIIEYGFTDPVNFDAQGNYIVRVGNALDYVKEQTKEFTIGSVEALKALATAVNDGNSFKGYTIKLGADLDLNNEEWTPIGTSTHKFQGTFDGQNHTISNLKITGNKSNVGLFGFTTDGEIKNLTVENATVTGYLNVGVVAGTPYTSKYTNITVKGHVEVNGFSYVGGVGGKNAYANWDNINVNVDETSYVKANSVEGTKAYRTYVGGVIGFMGEGGHKVSNVTSNINVIGSTCDVGGIVGIAHYGNTFENITCSGDVTINNAADAGDAEEMGGIAGVWHNGGANVTFTNCSFTGTLTANVTNGVDLTDNTITGAAYSKTGSGQLVIN